MTQPSIHRGDSYILAKPAHHRIDTILDELMTVEETDIQGKVELYSKLLRECIPLLDEKEEKDARNLLKDLYAESLKLMNNQPNCFLDVVEDLDTGLRRRIREKLGES
jgi:hypothetical protein